MTPFDKALGQSRKPDVAQFTPNEHGIWCPSCGNMVVAAHSMHDEDIELPEYCDECGYPDEADMAEYHCGEDWIDE